MKTFTAIFLFAAFSACSADISIALKKNNFSNTNEQGGYHFGFNDGRLARQEERTPEGVVRGAYRYVDANGEVQTVTYTADKHNGFVASGSNIPKIGRIPEPTQEREIIEVPPAGVVEDTPEVKAAKAKHFEAHQEALQGRSSLNVEQLPIAVQYTPEVAAARAQHLNALNLERLRSSNYYPTTYASQPVVQYIVPGAQPQHFAHTENFAHPETFAHPQYYAYSV